MANSKSVNCPGCGAQVEIDSYAAMAVCEYCRGAFYFKDEAILALGKTAILAETSSPLYLGATGSFKDIYYTVRGRIRYRYEEGFWDEWYLSAHNGAEIWIGEDEMEFSREEKYEGQVQLPAFADITPGQVIEVAGKEYTVDELDTARLEGLEGSIPFALTLDRTFPYVDASAGDDTLTIEYGEEGVELYLGTWISQEDLGLAMPKADLDDYGWSGA